MAKKTLALIHTSATLVPVFAELCGKYLPGIGTFNIVDDSLIKNTIASGRLMPDTARRVVNYAASAEDAGADYILFTCSSIGPAIETAATLTSVPVLRVDQPMADRAVETGKKIGVIATLSTTLDPTADLVKRRAARSGRQIELVSVLCEGAFDALMSGDGSTHDRLVAQALEDLAGKVDVIVLAQASMGRVANTLPEEKKRVPILSSPVTAMEFLATVLHGR